MIRLRRAASAGRAGRGGGQRPGRWCPARRGRGADAVTSPFRLDVHGTGRCEFSRMLPGRPERVPGSASAEILAFFVSPADPDDAVLGGDLEVPCGSPAGLLARRVAASPAATEAMGRILRDSIARCPCQPGTTGCPALDPPGLLDAMEAAARPATTPESAEIPLTSAVLAALEGHDDHVPLLRRLLLRRDRPVTAPDQPAAAQNAEVTAPDAAATRAASRDDGPGAADLMLARVASARILAARSGPARVMVLASVVVLAVTGVWLRGQVPPSGPLVAGACLVAVVWGVLLPWLGRWPDDPRWVPAARAHERLLEHRVPARSLAIATELAAEAGRHARRKAFLYVPRCARPGRPHLGACHLGGVLPLNERLLVVLGEHLAARPPREVSGMLGREVLHMASWRLPLTCARAVLGVAGPVLLGWAVPPPVLPAAIPAFMLVMTAASWATEVSCDLGAARVHGAAGILAGLDYLRGVITADRAAVPRWRQHAASTVTWLSGPPQPPLPLRRTLITALTRGSGSPASGWLA